MPRPTSLRRSLPGLRRFIRRFAPHLRRQPGLLAGSFAALLAEVALRLLEPWPLKFVFDRVIAPSATGGATGVPLVDKLDPMTVLGLSVIGLVLITGARALAAYGSTVGFALIGNRVVTEVRHELYRHLHDLSLSFHARARSGDLVVRMVGDVGLLKEVAVTAFLPLLGSMLILVGMLVVMLLLHWQLTIVALLTIPLFWLNTIQLGRRIRDVSREQRQREGEIAATAAESIGAIKLVQAYSLQGQFSRALSSQSAGSLKVGVKAKRLAANLERSVDALTALATALVLGYGALLVLRQELTPGDLLVFLTYLKNAFRPVRDFAKHTGRLAKAAASGERILDLLDEEPEVQNLPGAIAAPPFQGHIRFEQVSFAYEPGQPVLDGISFEASSGQTVALVAPSGAGKSTIGSLLLRLYDPTSGRICIDGRDIREYTLDSLRSQISVVLQDSLLFATSIADNIAYGTTGATPEQVRAAAAFANADGFIQSLPNGYETVLAERGISLSGGQRQRVALARAAIRQAPILILDEPAVGLDEENEQIVVQALERLARTRTTLLITHDLSLAARADVILYLERGRVVERGAPEELLRANGRYAALYRLQQLSHGSGQRRTEPHALAS